MELIIIFAEADLSYSRVKGSGAKLFFECLGEPPT